jgi:zinc protease
MRLKLTLTLLFACLLSGFTFAQQAKNGDEVQSQPMDMAIYYGHLPNGLTYYVRKNVAPKKRAVMYLVEKAGSLQEDDDQRGLAHFVEHMAFKGTPNFPKLELVSYLQKSGVTFGADVNAQTTFNQTCYQLTIPTDSMQVFNKGLDILADWAGHLSFDPGEINSERNVILEEERMRLKTAAGRMGMQTLAMDYNNSRFSDRLPIGTEESVKTIQADAFRKFYHDWYRPDAEAIIVVGDFNPSKVVQMIKDKFSSLQNPENERTLVDYSIRDMDGTRVKILTDKEMPTTYLGVTVRLPGTKERSNAEYMQKMRSTLFNFMLNTRIAEIVKKGNPPFLSASTINASSLGNTDVFITRLSAKPGELQNSVKTVFGEIERAKKFGFTGEEFRVAKDWYIRTRAGSFYNIANHESAAYAEEYRRNFLTEESVPGLEYEYVFSKANIDKIQLTDINTLLAICTSDQNRTVFLEAPEKDKSTLPDEKTLLDWINNPGGDDKAYESVSVDNNADILPDDLKAGKIESSNSDASGAETFVLSNGARVILKNTNYSAGQILFDIYGFGGTSLSSDADYPSASFAGALIRKSGVGNFDQVTLDKMLANKVSIEPFVSTYGEGMRGVSSQRHFETALKLIHLYFTAPRSDSTVWAGLVSSQRAFLANQSNSPATVFADSIRGVLYNYNPRGGHITEAMLKNACRNKSLDYFKQRFADASNFTFVFVGSLDDIGVRGLIKKYIASLPSTRSDETFKDLHMSPPPGKITKVIHKGIDDKSTVELLFHGPLEYNSENNLQIKALGDILQLKLNDRLRQQESGVYSPRAVAMCTTYPNPQYAITVYFTCASANADKLIAATMDEVNKIRQNGALPLDVQKFIADETRTTQTNLKRNAFWVDYLSASSRNKEDAGRINNYINSLSSVTVESTKAAANKYLNPDNFIQIEELPEGK